MTMEVVTIIFCFSKVKTDQITLNFSTTLLLHVHGLLDPTQCHRLVWCPYIPDDEDSSGTTANTMDSSVVQDDMGKILVLTHNNVVSSQGHFCLFAQVCPNSPMVSALEYKTSVLCSSHCSGEF